LTRALQSVRQTLALAGAKQFIVPNLPPLGSLPITNTYPSPIPQELNALSVAFNQVLQAEATQLEQSLGIHIQVLDVYGLIEGAFNDPSLYRFTNVTTDAVHDNGTDGQGYRFWDIVHPTTHADSLIAAAAVPEPSSVVMLGVALGGLAVWTGTRRRAQYSVN
jgi:phospholipase/lecithinase/hemolysin